MGNKKKEVSPVQYRMSWQNKEHIKAVSESSCYYCKQTFDSRKVKEWVDGNLTAICPLCGIDSVVAGRLSKKTLNRWHHESFEAFDETGVAQEANKDHPQKMKAHEPLNKQSRKPATKSQKKTAGGHREVVRSKKDSR